MIARKIAPTRTTVRAITGPFSVCGSLFSVSEVGDRRTVFSMHEETQSCGSGYRHFVFTKYPHQAQKEIAYNADHCKPLVTDTLNYSRGQ